MEKSRRSAPPARPFTSLSSLQVRVALTVTALVIGLAIALATLLSGAAERQILQLEATHLRSLSDQMARELSAGLDRFLRDVSTQALREGFRSASAPVEDMRQALNDFKRLNPEFAYVSIVDAETATVLAANDGIFEGGSGRGRPTFERGLKGPFLGDVHDAVRLAELLPKPENGEKRRFLDVAAPIRDATGRVFRVFAAHIGWEWTQAVRETLFIPMKDRRGIELILIDTSDKVVLAASDSVPLGTQLGDLSAKIGETAYSWEWPDGRACLTAISEVRPRGGFPGFGWKVVVRQPLDIATAPVQAVRNVFLVGGLLLGVIAAVLGWYLSAHLTRPVRELARAAAQAAAGESMEGAPAADEVQEVVTVRRAISRLADTARAEAFASVDAQQQFSVLVQSLPQLVWVADAHGWLVHANKPWLTSLGQREPFNIEDFPTLVVPEDAAAFRSAWHRELAQAGSIHQRSRFLIDDLPEPRWFDFQASAIRHPEDGRIRWIGTMFDVHEVVALAESSKRALAVERNARDHAERVGRMQDEFLAIVSHELRSPLNAIVGWAEILARKGVDDPMVSKAGEVIRRNAAFQASLIDDLMDVNAMRVSKLVLDLAPVDAAAIVRQVFMSQLHSAQQQGIELVRKETEGSIYVNADIKRLTQILTNLVVNALKFTDSGGRVQVSARSEGGRVIFQVQDTGRGIAADFLPHVFDRLRQADSSTTRRAGGLGLGLSIAKGLVELHGGKITVASDGLGLGATFCVELPELDMGIQQLEDRGEDAVAVNHTSYSGLRVLVVDDEEDAREVTQIALASMGASVQLAASGQEALKRLEDESFDMLVSDLGMPDMDGFMLIRAVRQRGLELGAVALTAFSDRRAEVQGAGFDAYVKKPISVRHLSEGLERARQATSARA